VRLPRAIACLPIVACLAMGLVACSDDDDGTAATQPSSPPETTSAASAPTTSLVDAAPTAEGGQATPAAEPAEGQISIVDFAFSPAEADVPAGTEVVWTNADGAAHQIVADDGSFPSQNLAQGDTYSITLEPGTYGYFCGIHNSMTGSVTVA
jgi:plastocyanin